MKGTYVSGGLEGYAEMAADLARLALPEALSRAVVRGLERAREEDADLFEDVETVLSDYVSPALVEAGAETWIGFDDAYTWTFVVRY